MSNAQAIIGRAFGGCCDGAKWGVSDFYEDTEKALVSAMGVGGDFDTGWYSVKKEIQNGRIEKTGAEIHVQVSISDDFDTQGDGDGLFTPKPGDTPVSILGEIVSHLDTALAEAMEDKKDKELFSGFSIHVVDRDGQTGSWIETVILPRGDGCEMEYPPGDYYHSWGIQGDSPPFEIPAGVLESMLTWANDFVWGDAGDTLEMTAKTVLGTFRIKPWEV